MLEQENDHNVYILGAGFSQGAGYPVTNNFLDRMRDAHPWLQAHSQWQSDAIAVGKVLKYRLEAAAAAYWTPLDLENIENLFSLAAAESAATADGQTVGDAIAATIDYVDRTRLALSGTTTIRADPPLGKLTWTTGTKSVVGGGAGPQDMWQYPMETYAHAVATLLGRYSGTSPKGRNTFITFNYDNLIERALHAIHVPWSYGVHNDTVDFEGDVGAIQTESDVDLNTVRLLKLHGSVTWGCPENLAPSGRMRIFSSYTSLRDHKHLAVLVPPSWQKSFDRALRSVWRESVKTLSRATRIVVIGFSMPPTDLHFRYLLSAGLKSNAHLRAILFVDQNDKEIKARAAKILNMEYLNSGRVRFLKDRALRFCAGQSNWDNLDTAASSLGPKDSPLEWIGRDFPRSSVLQFVPGQSF